MNTRRTLFALAALPLLAATTACTTTPPAAPKPSFVLVHGAFQDERAWSEVVPRLQAAGHAVVAVRLAGRAGDATPLEAITLDTYRRQVADAVAAQPGPVVLTAERYGRVPKVVGKTLRDRAISPQLQQLMIERTPVQRVLAVDSGHSPFLSQPEALARALLEAARD